MRNWFKRRGFSACVGGAVCLTLFSSCSSQSPSSKPDSDGSVLVGTMSDAGTDLRTSVSDASDADTASEDTGPSDADAGDALAPDTGGGDTAPVYIWTESSRRVDLLCGSFALGSMKFSATREQLSDTQLALLSQMTLLGSAGPCFPDVTQCRITLTQADDSVAVYDSVQEDTVCNAPVGATLVTYASFDPFRRSLPCLYSLAGGIAGQVAPPVAPDGRCLNGLISFAQAPVDRFLSVSDPGVLHHVDIDGCDGAAGRRAADVHLQLFADSQTTPLAEGAAVADPGVDQTCVRLDYTFATAGTYRISIALPAAPGDLFFKFY
jgi:hypothetical protein